MQSRFIWTAVIGLTVLVLGAGIAGAASPIRQKLEVDRNQTESAAIPALVAQANAADTITYQGRLTSPGGAPLDGTFSMRFVLYNDAVAGAALWDSGNVNVTVSRGLFEVNLDVDQADFDGQALWLNIIVGGETLSPRQEILPAPYALSLRPGAKVNNVATGFAVQGTSSNGIGFYGSSSDNYGVWGESDNSWGGYFTSNSGHGIRVNTDGTAHYDYGAYITSNGGYAVYAQSASNQGVRGEAGNISGILPPLGPVGVVGIGSSRGVYGGSNNGPGVYGRTNGNYGVWGQSATYRGVTGRTDRPDNNYGLYTPDNFYSFNYNLRGAIMQVVQNGGRQIIEVGDVVVFSGISRPEKTGEFPVVQVSKAEAANSQAVAGVVFSKFNIEAVDEQLERPDGPNPGMDIEVTPAGSVAPGEYLLLVIQGPVQVKVSNFDGEIQPGDLLAASSSAGHAAKAADITVNGLKTALPGTVIGKALEPVSQDQDMIFMFVTLQ